MAGAATTAVPVVPGTTTVSCTFRPPGLTPGLAAGAAGLVLLAGRVGLGRRARRQRAE